MKWLARSPWRVWKTSSFAPGASVAAGLAAAAVAAGVGAGAPGVAPVAAPTLAAAVASLGAGGGAHAARKELAAAPRPIPSNARRDRVPDSIRMAVLHQPLMPDITAPRTK